MRSYLIVTRIVIRLLINMYKNFIIRIFGRKEIYLSDKYYKFNSLMSNLDKNSFYVFLHEFSKRSIILPCEWKH